MLFGHDSDKRFQRIVAEQEKKQEAARMAEEAEEAKKRMEQEAEEAKTRAEEAKLKSTYMYQLQNLGKQVYSALPSRNDMVYNSFTPLVHIPARRFFPSLYSDTGSVADTSSAVAPSEERESRKGLTVGQVFLDRDMSIDYYVPVQITDSRQLGNYRAYLALFEEMNTKLLRLIHSERSRHVDTSNHFVNLSVYRLTAEIRKEKETLLTKLSEKFQKLYEDGKKIILLKYFMDQCLGYYKESNDDRQLMTNLATFYRQLYVITGGYYYFIDTYNFFYCLPIEIVVMAVLTSLNNENHYSIGYYKSQYNRGLPLFADWENPNVSYESEEQRDNEIEKILKFYEKHEEELKKCTRRHKPTPASVSKAIKYNMHKFIGSFDYYKELLPDDQHQGFMIAAKPHHQRLMIADAPRASHTPRTSQTPRTSHTPPTEFESETFYNNLLSQDLNVELDKDRKLRGLLRVGAMCKIAEDIISLRRQLYPVMVNKLGYDITNTFKLGGKSRKQRKSKKQRKSRKQKQSRKQKKSKKSRK